MGQALQAITELFEGRDGVVVDIRAPVSEGDSVAAGACATADGAISQLSPSVKYLQSYSGNDAMIRKAVSSPNDTEAQAEAFRGMFPNIAAIKGCYEASQRVDKAWSELVRAVLRAEGAMLLQDGAMVGRLARVLEGVFMFDWAKMEKPAVQNDFSFYRRALGRSEGGEVPPVSGLEAEAISMFIAQSNPLLYTVTASHLAVQKTVPALVRLLPELEACCLASAAELRKASPQGDLVATDLQTLHLAALMAAVLFDRVDSAGLFAPKSPIDVRRLVAALKGWDADKRTKDFALSTLQYSTRSFSKAPPAIRKLFA